MAIVPSDLEKKEGAWPFLKIRIESSILCCKKIEKSCLHWIQKEQKLLLNVAHNYRVKSMISSNVLPILDIQENCSLSHYAQLQIMAIRFDFEIGLSL